MAKLDYSQMELGNGKSYTIKIKFKSLGNIIMGILKRLNKLKLDFNPVMEYVIKQLGTINTLSCELLKLLNFKEGHFFTLLPDDANLKGIHHFKWGGILPQNPIQEQIIDGRRSTFTWIPDTDKEMSLLILNEIKSKPHLSCILDDVEGGFTPEDKSAPCFSDNFSVFYGDEIYSLITKDNASYDLISLCLKYSFSFWHSLCVLTTADLTGITLTKTLSLEKIMEICLATQLVMVGAYDGEGYVFWEKNLTAENKGFFVGDQIYPQDPPPTASH
jgi:hypothetical protein